MSWALVVQKNKEKLQKEILDQVKNESVDKDNDIVVAPTSRKENEDNIEE